MNPLRPVNNLVPELALIAMISASQERYTRSNFQDYRLL